MNKIKHAKLYVLGLAFVVALLPVASYAHDGVDHTSAESLTEARCTVAKTKLSTKVTAATTARTEFASKYETISTKVDKIVTSAATAGYPEVSNLTEAQTNVKTAIDSFTAQATTYKKALDTAQASTCGQSTGEFITALATARAELVKLRTESTKVKTVIKTEAVPALREYATWLKATATDTKESE